MAKSFYTTGTGNEQTLTPIINEKVPIYDTVADAEADLANLEVGQIVKTKDAGLVANLNPIDEVKQGVFLPPTSNAVAKSLSYSTTEQKTGGKWIDGKDIYRKVVDLGNLPNATTKSVSHGISNIGLVTDLRGMWYISNDYRILPYLGGGATYDVYLDANNTNIRVQTGMDRSGFTGFAIIEYTKTTD